MDALSWSSPAVKRMRADFILRLSLLSCPQMRVQNELIILATTSDFIPLSKNAVAAKKCTHCKCSIVTADATLFSEYHPLLTPWCLWIHNGNVCTAETCTNIMKTTLFMWTARERLWCSPPYLRRTSSRNEYHEYWFIVMLIAFKPDGGRVPTENKNE